MVKVKVIKPILYGGMIRNTGFEFWLKEEEAQFLLNNGYIEIIEKRNLIETKNANDIEVKEKVEEKNQRPRKRGEVKRNQNNRR